MDCSQLLAMLSMTSSLIFSNSLLPLEARVKELELETERSEPSRGDQVLNTSFSEVPTEMVVFESSRFLQDFKTSAQITPKSFSVRCQKAESAQRDGLR